MLETCVCVCVWIDTALIHNSYQNKGVKEAWSWELFPFIVNGPLAPIVSAEIQNEGPVFFTTL